MKINKQVGFTDFFYEIEEEKQIKEDLKIHLDPIVALVFWVNRAGAKEDPNAISLMWSVVEKLNKERLNEN